MGRKGTPTTFAGVHAQHCCTRHGCKYGNPECPVVRGRVAQEVPCSECERREARVRVVAAELAKSPIVQDKSHEACWAAAEALVKALDAYDNEEANAPRW